MSRPTHHQISAFAGRIASTTLILLGAAAVLVPTVTKAELLASATNTTAQLFNVVAGTPVDLNGAGAGTSISFGCNVPSRVMITFSAECSQSGTTAQWGSIQIVLNGTVLPPTVGNDDAFCSGDGNAGASDSWATQSMEVVGACRQGGNVLAVRAGPRFAGTTMRLDDMSTVVDR